MRYFLLKASVYSTQLISQLQAGLHSLYGPLAAYRDRDRNRFIDRNRDRDREMNRDRDRYRDRDRDRTNKQKYRKSQDIDRTK